MAFEVSDRARVELMVQLRSLLFVPGNRADMLEKAKGMTPDALLPDMEDSVPPGEKERGRDIVSSYVPELAKAGHVVIPRANAVATGLLEDDLEAVVGPDIFGVTVGKVGGAQDVLLISDILERLEERAGLPRGQVKLVPWLETAKGVVNAYQICSASPRVVAAAFGAEDLSNDMGIERTEDGAEVAHARNAVSLAARAADVLALDTPYVAFRDADGLRRDALSARAIGYRGKFAIHPSQIDIINDAFSPTEAEIEHARRVVAVYEEAERSGSAATSLDGMMIDVPIVRRAQGLLELAARAAEGRV